MVNALLAVLCDCKGTGHGRRQRKKARGTQTAEAAGSMMIHVLRTEVLVVEVVTGGADNNTNVHERLDAGLREVLLEVSCLDTSHGVLHGSRRKQPAEKLGDRPLEELMKRHTKTNQQSVNETNAHGCIHRY